MKRFNVKVFRYSLPIAIGIALSVALVVIIDVRVASSWTVAATVVLSLLSSGAFSVAVASYGYPIDAMRWSYRSVMRTTAKRAVRASLSEALTPIACLGIIDRNGTVALRIAAGRTDGMVPELPLNVYDAVNSTLWGRVKVVEVNDAIAFCEPYDRNNPDFWGSLEDRMRTDTSPPGVFLVREVPTNMIALVNRLLDHWR